ncbi:MULTISPECIES: YMGG-like glycine zipper-containing protein [unclassified Pseudomonas]|uniref:YMGG-like glycine zipper-containing protein n=1 Tax=unclassified Pseudomonas TaxID=196821 RepID=UPI001F4F71CD|nr:MULTISPECIES: YMGG-like glycine zipper-containing protein [unclassified Pseudomonas]
MTVFAVSLIFSVTAGAATVVPLKNQSSETIQKDTGTCRTQANDQHPISTDVAIGGRVRGAAVGAAAGVTAAQIKGHQHERIYDQLSHDTQQDYRQNHAISAATAGAIVGGARQRHQRQQAMAATDQAVRANNSVYSACLQQRGYEVLP